MLFFSTQNTQVLSLYFANYSINSIPVYIVVLVSLLLGFFVSWVINLFDVISSSFKIRGKESTIKQADKQISELTKKVHELELENARLKGESGHPNDDKSL